jgi:hypothetical protein
MPPAADVKRPWRAEIVGQIDCPHRDKVLLPVLEMCQIVARRPRLLPGLRLPAGLHR